MNKIFKHLARLTKKKTQTTNIKKKTGGITTNLIAIKITMSVKRCSISHVIREVEIKATMRRHSLLIRKTNIQITGTKSW